MKVFSSQGRRRPRSSPKERASWVRRYERAGLSQREFADRHHLGLFALRNWIAQSRNGLRSQGQAQAVWKELKLEGLPGVTPWAAEVVRPDGWTVRLAHNAPANLVEELLRKRSC
jgi:transposase-like protein